MSNSPSFGLLLPFQIRTDHLCLSFTCDFGQVYYLHYHSPACKAYPKAMLTGKQTQKNKPFGFTLCEMFTLYCTFLLHPFSATETSLFSLIAKEGELAGGTLSFPALRCFRSEIIPLFLFLLMLLTFIIILPPYIKLILAFLFLL